MRTDRFITRLVAVALAIYGAVEIGVGAWQAGHGHKVDGSLHDLAYLIIGGFLSRLDTGHNNNDGGTQQVEVPAPLIPDDSLAAPENRALTPDSNAQHDIHPDAPEESDL